MNRLLKMMGWGLRLGLLSALAGVLLSWPASATVPGTGVTCVASKLAYGASTTCTATVTGSNPTGAVAFTSSRGDGSFIPGDATCTLSGGTCSVSYTLSASGCLIACLDTTVSITGSYGGDGNNPPSSGSAPVMFHTCWLQQCLINSMPLSTEYDDWLCIIGNVPSDALADCKHLVEDFSGAKDGLTDDILKLNVGINFPGAGAWAALASGHAPGSGCGEVTAAIGYATAAGEFDLFGDGKGGLNLGGASELQTVDCVAGLDLYNAGVIAGGHTIPDIDVLQGLAPLLTGNAALQQVVAEVAVSVAVACGGVSYICNASDIIATLISNEHDLQAKQVPVALLAQGTWGSHSGPLGIGWSLASCNTDGEFSDTGNLCGGSLCVTDAAACVNPPTEGTATDDKHLRNTAATVQCATGRILGLGIGFDGDVSFDVNDVAVSPAPLTDTTPSAIRKLLNPHNFASGSGGTAPPNGIDVEIPLADRGTFHDQILALRPPSMIRPGSLIKVCGYWVTDMHDLWNELHPVTSLTLEPDFTLAASLSEITLQATETATTTLTTTLVSGPSSPVSFSVISGLPMGATPTFTPSVVTPAAGAPAQSTLTVTGLAVGDYTVTIQGQSEDVIMTATLVLHVYDYTMAVSLPDETVLRGGSARYTVSMALVPGSSMKGMIPAIVLTAPGLPADALPVFVPPNLIPTLAGVSSTLSVGTSGLQAGSLGDFSFAVTAINPHGTMLSIPANLHLYDFTVMVAPASLQVLTTGSNAYSTGVSLTSASSSMGLPAIALSGAGLPPLVSGSFSPTMGPAAGFRSTLSITTSGAASSAGIPLTIAGTDSRAPEGGTRSTSATLVVLTPAQALPLVINQINSFKSANVLTSGQANSFITKLNQAIISLTLKPPDKATACNQLNAFVNEVNSYVALHILTPAQANLLLGGPLGVNAIRAAIPC